MLWFGAIFLFFSTASSKLATYILPLFPAISLLVAALWGDLWVLPAQDGPRKEILYPLAFFMAATTVVMVYILVRPLDVLFVNYGIAPERINILGDIMVACTALIFFLFLSRHYKSAFAAMTGMIVIGLMLFLVLIVPYINPYRSTKGLAEIVDPLLPQGEKLTFFHRLQDTTLFYTDRKATILWGKKSIVDLLASDERVFCVMEKKYFDDLKTDLPGAHVWAEEGDKLLISNMKP